MSTWIDFKELRANLDFEEVLRHYGVEVKRKGNQHLGVCPLPGHNGKRNSPSFSANLERGIFQCFGCGAKGNVLEFAALMQGVDTKNGAAFRSVALDVKRRFCPDTRKAAPEHKLRESPPPSRPPKAVEPESSGAVINAPLDFELKGLDPNHPYLRKRGFTPETVAHFGLGLTPRTM
jgi:DNA primase